MKFNKILITILQALSLALLICFERVIGLPLLFTLAGLIWLDQLQKDSYYQPLVLLFISYILATVYNLSWSISLLVWFVTYLLMGLNLQQIKTKNRRFLIITLLQNLFWLWWMGLTVNYVTLAQLVISYLLVVIWARVFKIRKKQQTIL